MESIDYSDKAGVEKIIARFGTDYHAAIEAVKAIVDDVRNQGDSALYRYTLKFDKFNLDSGNIKVGRSEIKAAYGKVEKDLVKSLKVAYTNISRFHKAQHAKSKQNWSFETTPGVKVGEVSTPIESVGCYVPGGRASYPSTVLMTSVPAKIAGVKRIVVVSPPPINPVVLVACDIAGVDEIYQVGGAQAVVALAYGTESIKKVSKIVGPGNKYVTAAKMLVYGVVDIDMPAGPSEVLIIADKSSNPKYIALDLLAQAEHDPDAKSVLASDSEELIKSVSAELSRSRKTERKLGEIIAVKTKTLSESIAFANDYAAEHLELTTKNAEQDAKKIRNAGAIFIGPYSCVAAGDYATGGNHVLPTGGTAKFSSQLSVRDFMKTTSVQKISKDGLKKIGAVITTLAESEGLKAHKESVEKRLD